jgi:formiminotetrahydrofolate cyclodeaminase
MVAAYSVGKKTAEPVRGRVEPIRDKLRRLDELLRRLIAEDAAAYVHMTAADRADGPAHQAAVIAAVSVPLGIAAAASEALEVLDDLKGDASRYLLSDLGVAAVMADATARAAAYSVRVNLPEVADPGTRDRLADDIRRIVGHCDRRRASIEAFVGDRLSG